MSVQRRRRYARFLAPVFICAVISLFLDQPGRAISKGTIVYQGDPISQLTVSVYGDDDDCSGVKIAFDLILTAKHCVIDRSTKVIFANRSAYTIIRRFVPYSKGFRANKEHDVAVLRIEGHVPGPVAELSNKLTVPKDGATAWTAGYGGRQVTETSNPLRKAKMIISDAYYSPFLIAVQVQKGEGVCDGDSGAPGYTEVGGQVVVWGINSASLRGNAVCGSRELYAKTTLEDEWLRDVVAENRVAVQY